MILDFQAWFCSSYWISKEVGWKKEWRMTEVKSIHLGTNKVILPVAGGNHSFEIGDKCILRPYAQIQDDEGKKLYTGDITWISNTLVENMPTYKAEVVWDKYRFAFRAIDMNLNLGLIYQNADTFGLSVKLIGNKYQNPELLSNES